MFKKLFLCLLLTTNLYPVSQADNDKYSPVVITAMILGAGIIALDLYAFANSTILEELISGNDEAVGKVLVKIITTITASMGVLAIPELYPISKEIYEYTFPTEEQKAIDKAEAAAAIENINFIDAKVKLRNCLMNSKSNCEKNTSGCPTDCEELAQNLIALGHQDEVNRMTKALNACGQ